ncbi:MAG: hypothetical protein R2848_16500 [Thermomicrobiales bacterium]
MLFGVLGLFEATAAQESPDYAGIVIRPGDGTVTYAYVPLEEPVSGIELLRGRGVARRHRVWRAWGRRLPNRRDGLRYRLLPLSVVPDRRPEFPLLAVLSGRSRRELGSVATGGSATKVEPGGIDGWSWTPDESLLPDVDIEDIPALAGALEAPGEAHFARYDANGNLVDRADVSDVEQRSYVAVIGVLGAVALFTVGLRARQRGAT